ncbi:MAG: MBL fold metallo-hydrolase [Patescibacteria group bacterium]|nr:MBL fold metallo-hydrolase [Patescibacteria group bacterium]MCL5224051.1 MBL fold metallo-hydrolase [Patescibacteria group bacterium]
MKIKFLGAAGTVTGSSYLIASGDDKVLVDCGLFQGESYCERDNFAPLPYDPKTIRAVFITHAHIDHTGLLPKLVKAGYAGPIYSTAPTRDFAKELLLDSEDILSREAEQQGQTPLYTAEDVEAAMRLWHTIGYKETVKAGGFEVHFIDAGHIMGSASAVIFAEGKRLVMSGDLGNENPPLIPEGELIPADADYAVIESCYGDRQHEDFGKRREILEDVIENAVKMGGALMIPAFAMERLQELLYEINFLVENRKVPRMPIFIDSPLAIRLTRVYEHYESFMNSEARKFMWQGRRELLNFPGIRLTLTREESRSIEQAPMPKMIIAGSGMSNGGRITYHESLYLPDPKSTLLIVGYQVSGTLGRQIQEGAKEVRIMGKSVKVAARIVSISGYSAHADQPRLLQWLSPARGNLKKVFVTHGEEKVSQDFAAKALNDLAVATEVPHLGEEVVL